MSDSEDDDKMPAGLSSSEEEDSDASSEEENTKSKKSKKRKLKTKLTAASKKKKKENATKMSLIDDAAVLSGSDDDDDDDEEEGDDVEGNDYVKDDFVVDDEVAEMEDDGLNDSDDDSDEEGTSRKRSGRTRIGKKQNALSQEDLDLIAESKGNYKGRSVDADIDLDDEVARKRKATKINELRNELFIDDEGDEGRAKERRKKDKKQRKRPTADTFDEEGMEDFIDDDDEGRARYRDELDEDLGGDAGVSEAQINEANDIFGTEFLDFMQEGEGEQEDMSDEDGEGRSKKYRERGVGVSLGIDSDDGIDLSESDDDDDDLFGDDDDGKTTEQRAEALRLKREKRRLAKEERRKKKTEQRKARLRRAFEPVQLIENFCTDRDDEIRSKDAPERFFDWKTPFHGPADDITAITLAEEQEATWIVKRIPEIASEYAVAEAESKSGVGGIEETEQKTLAIIESIIKTLRFLHREKLEPEFIRRYRVDEVTSPAVRDHIYRIMDEDTEWERLINAKSKVEALLDSITQSAESDEALGADEEYVSKLKEDLKNARDRLDENVRDEERKKAEIDALDQDDDDDDDDLFGDDDDENDEKKKKKEIQKESLYSHLKTTQSLVKVCAEQVSSIEASLKIAEENSAVSQPGQKDALMTTAQVCRDKLWHQSDYRQYLNNLSEYRHIMDLYNYLKLIKEGNEAVQNKSSTGNEKDKKKRSKRFDRDYYRTCVSQGLRRISYQFALSPFRTGIKLEDNQNLPDGFNWEKTLPGDNPNSGDDSGDPRLWNAPTVELSDPTSFASDLVSSGELVLLASMNEGGDNNASQDNPEVNDPLRGCRYVAAMELAYEPRIRRYMREIFKQKAVITTRPTAKGMDIIDPFHEFYGLHLLRNKKVKDHFHPDTQELEMQTFGFSAEERKEMDERIKNIERQSCLQYLNVMKAEKSGHLKVHIHLPMLEESDDWYKKDNNYFNNRENQDLSPMVDELKKIYFPSDGDHDEWNKQREQILRFALKKFLLPFFEGEMKRELRETAFKVGLRDAGKNLLGMAMEGPYRPSHLLGDNRFLVPTGDLPIVGVCCSSDNKDASYLVAVTERGEVSDHLAIPAGIQIDSGKIREKVITFLMQSRPAAIVVGSHAGLSSRLVARKLGALATEATERWNNRFIQGQDEDEDEYQTRQDEFRRLYPDHEDEEEEETDWKCNVEMVDDNVAQLFGRSVRGKKEFPDSATNLKCAISIARHAKDPLAEICYTWSVASDAGVFGTEMLFLSVHPLQRLLPKTLLLREYERILCRAVAEVGVDINLACKYDHIHGLLSFIPGLGPRKAASLKHGLDRIGGVVASRRDLLGKRLVGPFVYNNAVAFLRIRDIDALSNQLLHPLDDTRLHTHVYHRNNWATKIAIDALEMDNDDTANSGNDDKAITAIRDIMDDSHNEVQRLFDATKVEWERVYGHATFNVGAWDPRINVPAESWRDKVEELDLETFADMIEKDGKGKWLSHLTMIKWEFRLPFEDSRIPMEPLEKEKLFRMLTGESDQTLCPGREVTGRVGRISDFGAHLKLEGDVPAFIPLRNLSDGHVESAEEIVQVGQIVTAIITEVKKDHMSVDLSLKQEDLKKAPSSWDRPSSLPPLDQSFDKTTALRIEGEKSKEREERLAKMNVIMGGGKSDKPAPAIGRTGRVTARACTHPAFRNKSHLEVEKELKEGGEMMVGEALIKPSKTNADVLTLYWHIREGVVAIKEIQEEDKDNDASVGNTLKIKDEVYGSIDELLARYIAPMNDRVDELKEHPKFMDKSEDDVDTYLKAQKETQPKRVFYNLCWNEKYTGYASLRYILNSTPRYHHIGITTEGFTWCSKTYPDINFLLNAFKKEPRGKSSSKNSSGDASRSSRDATSRSSRWAPRSSAPPPPRQPPTWTAPPAASATGYRPPPPSMPPPPQHAYPPVMPGTNGWSQQRPPPPSLPPPPQHRYPPAPPGPPPGYPSQ